MTYNAVLYKERTPLRRGQKSHGLDDTEQNKNTVNNHDMTAGRSAERLTSNHTKRGTI